MLPYGEFKVIQCDVTKSYDIYFQQRTGSAHIVASIKKEAQATAIAEHMNNIVTGKIRPDRRRKR